MDAAKMARRFVFFGIADGAKGVMRFERHFAQRIRTEGQGGRGKVAPLACGEVILGRRVKQCQTYAFKRNQAVGKLVLHRLKTADRFAELFAFLGVVHRHFERAPRRAMRAREAAEACDESKFFEALMRQVDHYGRCGLQNYLSESCYAHRTDGSNRHTFHGKFDHGQTGWFVKHGDEVRCARDCVDEAQAAADAPALQTDCAGIGITIMRTG